MLQQIHAQTIIVIHPGSLYIRLGRASDVNPHTELHAVARKRLAGGLPPVSYTHLDVYKRQDKPIATIEVQCFIALKTLFIYCKILNCK